MRKLEPVLTLPLMSEDAYRQEILDFLAGKITKWWLPDDIVFIDAVPKTSVGKFNKRVLREQFKDYVLPGSVTEPRP